MFGARLILIASAIGVGSIAGHTAAGHHISFIGLVLTVALATALANTVARPPARLLPIAAVALGSQLLLHLVLSITAHGHGSLMPDATMMVAHAIAAVLIAVVAVEADRLIAGFRNLFSFDVFTLPRLITLGTPTFAAPAVSLRPSHRTAWSSRGPPLFS
jgi:hypothetical protein